MVKRLKSVDIFRGFLIFYVIILHPLIQRVFAQNASEVSNQVDILPLAVIIIAIPIAIVSLWGSAFTFLTGTTTAFQIAKKLENPDTDFKVLLRGKFVNSCLILVAHFILLAFFFNMTQEHSTPTYSMITGSIESGEFNSPTILHFLTSTTLQSIAYTGIIISLVLYISWNKNGYNPDKAIRNLGILAFFSLVMAFIFDSLMLDPSIYADSLLDRHNYLGYFLYMQIFVVRFAIFPVLAFGAVGAIFGILFAEEKSFKRIRNYGLAIGLTGISIFFIFLFNGFDPIEKFAEEHVPLPLQFLNLGLQVLVVIWQAKLHDYRPAKKAPIRKKSIVGRLSTMFQRYGALSLTIFMLESFISIIYYKITLEITGLSRLDLNIGVALCFEFACILTWFVIVKMWKKHNFKYSAEWMIGKAKKRIMKTPTLLERTQKVIEQIQELGKLIQLSDKDKLIQTVDMLIKSVDKAIALQ